MLLLAHVGITLASAAVGFRLKYKLSGRIPEDKVEETCVTCDRSHSSIRPDTTMSFFGSLANRVDVRFLLVGSILPDIIDKPIGIYLFRETFSSGRIFAHTLLFLVLLTVAGLLIKRYSGKTWGMALSMGTLFHLILDTMWQMPKTLLWPILGLGFEKLETANYLGNILYELLNEPGLFVTEMTGFLLIIWFVGELLHRRAIIGFIKQGRVH